MFRKHGRTSIRCPMLLRHQRLGALDVVTKNISASGIFIGVQPPLDEEVLGELRLGDMLEAQIESPDSESERVRLQVARLEKNGFALMFI
ncbi:MAG: PilZ domain-containing protein [Cellvibrionaceae bacterium]|nr:PilZ domain-containing protein [Cellvibrionaceae bacterium]